MAVRISVESQIQTAGHVVATKRTGSSYFIGLVESDDWGLIPAARKVILKNPAETETVPRDAHLFNLFTLVNLTGAHDSMCDFLRNNPLPAIT